MYPKGVVKNYQLPPFYFTFFMLSRCTRVYGKLYPFVASGVWQRVTLIWLQCACAAVVRLGGRACHELPLIIRWDSYCTYHIAGLANRDTTYLKQFLRFYSDIKCTESKPIAHLSCVASENYWLAIVVNPYSSFYHRYSVLNFIHIHTCIQIMTVILL